MADTAVSPNNVKIAFKGKPMGKSKPTTGAPAAAEMGGMERDYEAEGALRTMKEADQHAANPDMMKRVAKHATKESDGLASVMEKMRKQGLISDRQAEKTAQKLATRRA